MNTSGWERAKEILNAALDLEPDQRPEFVLQECGEDTALREEVESLLKADADAGSFLDPKWIVPFTPFAGQPTQAQFQLMPGDVVSGRFRILRLLGDGGMGRVYEAQDSVLGVQVALKTLRPEISSNPEVLSRFRQEVRIAHRITHPNVCRTFHLDRDVRQAGPDDRSPVELTFLTMEFLQGETLQQRLKREGRMPIAEALLIAQQMANALEAAHQTGIVHRDIKPGNVMICPAPGGEQENRVVVTDFGLAKFAAGGADGDVTSISHPGSAMGTLAYMSPEQLQAGDVGPATDVYAFGLVLYEMMTGAKAFPDSNTMAAAYRRTIEPPPSPRALVRDLPAVWETAILGCLQIDPANRFQHPSELMALLNGTPPDSSRLRKLPPRNAAQPTFSRRKVFAAAIVSITTVALFFFGFRYYKARTEAAVAPGTLVYLASIENKTGEKQLDHVTELLRAGLQQSVHINLLDSGRVGDLLQQMSKVPDAAIDPPTAREIAMRSGAARVVFGTVTGGPERYRLNVEIQQPDSTPARYRSHSQHSWSWQPSAGGGSISRELLGAIRDADDWVRHTVGESSNDIAQLDAPPEDVTTADWQALADFAYGEKLFHQGKMEEAITALRRALEQDPQFALALGFLGDVLTNAGHPQEGTEAYRKALDAGLNGRLSLRERARIKGMVAYDSFDLQAAEEAYREYTLYYEHDSEAWFRRARPLFLMGQTHEALSALEHAHQLNPAKPAQLIQISGAYLVLGDQAAVDSALAEMQQRFSREYYLYALAPVQVARGQYDAAAASLQELANSNLPAFQWAGAAMLANLRAEQGRYADALTILNRRIELDAKNAFLLTARAQVHCQLRQYEDCVRDLESAQQNDQGYLVALQSTRVLGQALSASSSHDAGRSLLRSQLRKLEARKQDSNEGLGGEIVMHRVRGEALLADDEARVAIREFRGAAALDASTESREYLARALTALAAKSKAGAEAQGLWKEALGITGTIALHPAAVWEFSQIYPPGFYADQLEAWLGIERHVSSFDSDDEKLQLAEQKRAVQAALQHIRPSAAGGTN